MGEVSGCLDLDRTTITAVLRACTLASRTASREHVVPTEWQVRTVLGDCISKAKVTSLRAPQYRQYTLISDFLDLANLSIQEEAALPTNWINDRPDGLQLLMNALVHVLVNEVLILKLP